MLFHRKTSFFLKYFVQDCGWKRLCPAKSVKYLDIKIDKNLNGKDDVHDTTTKPNIANARLYKIRNSLNFHTFKAIYWHLSYSNLEQGQNLNSMIKIITLQKKAWRIINNQPENNHFSQLFEKSNIMKFQDKILSSKLIFRSKSANNQLPLIFKNWFIFWSDFYIHDTGLSLTENVLSLCVELILIEKNSFIVEAINCWNKTQNMLGAQFPNSFKFSCKNMYW